MNGYLPVFLLGGKNIYLRLPRYLQDMVRQDRNTILAARWPAEKSTVVIDELHKYRRWKSWLKEEYDSQGAVSHWMEILGALM